MHTIQQDKRTQETDTKRLTMGNKETQVLPDQLVIGSVGKSATILPMLKAH